MPMEPETIRDYILQALPDATIDLIDTAGDKDHYSLTVTSAAFIGHSRVQQHKMVYQALQSHMGTTLHAMQVKTAIPQGAAQ